MIVILRCVTRDHWFFEVSLIILGILGIILVVTVPICVLTLLGHPLVMTLAPLRSNISTTGEVAGNATTSRDE